MGTLLKVFTVIILFLAVFAFIMGLELFSKREELIGRTVALETKIKQIAATIEDKAPEFTGFAERPARDISPVEENTISSPDENDFWADTKYDFALEIRTQPGSGSTDMINLSSAAKEEQLGKYYLMENVDGKLKVKKSEATGQKITTGKGTMDDLLKDVLEKAQLQYKRLNDTRIQLESVRKELETVIGLLNAEKQSHRSSKVTIKNQRNEIARLQSTIDDRDAEIAKQKREISNLNDEVTERDKQILKYVDDIRQIEIQVRRKDEEILALKDKLAGQPIVGTTQNKVATIVLSPGEKGKIVNVNKEFGFVVIQLNDIAKNEITANGTGFAPAEMFVYRKENGVDTIVSKIRITNPPDDKNISIADIVYGWTQTPIKDGDILLNK